MIRPACLWPTAFLLVLAVFPSAEGQEAPRRSPDAEAIMRFLHGLPSKKENRIISGQFERWGSAVEPLASPHNFLNIVHRRTGRWVGLAGVEYHMGPKVVHQQPNQFCIEFWNQGGLCQLYLIMSNPAEPAAPNGGGKCDVSLVLDPRHAFNKYFRRELDEVSAGLRELQQRGVVVFINLFAEATGNWFWWGAKDPGDFVALYRDTYNYLVNTKGLNNLLFVYEPSSHHSTAIDYYPGDQFVDMIGISMFTDSEQELTRASIPNYQALLNLGKPMALSQWGPRRGKDQTGDGDQPPADNMKLIRGIVKYYPEIVWWMNWNYAYAISTVENSNFNDRELLAHPWVINLGEVTWRNK